MNRDNLLNINFLVEPKFLSIREPVAHVFLSDKCNIYLQKKYYLYFVMYFSLVKHHFLGKQTAEKACFLLICNNLF